MNGVPVPVRSAWGVIWRSAAFFAAWALLLAPLIVPFAPALAGWEGTFPLKARLYMEAVGALTMLTATGLMVRFIDRRPFLSVGFALHHLGRDALAGVAFGTLWLAASVGAAWGAGWITRPSAAQVSWAVLLGAALATLLNVLTQQLLLCGYIFQLIRRQAGLIVAVGLSALLFSAYHFGAFKGAWLPAVNVFLAGTLFCLAFGLTESLWLPVSIHFAWNFLLGPALGLTVSGSSGLGSGWRLLEVAGPELWTGGGFGLEGGLVVTLTTAAGIFALTLALVRAPSRRHGLPEAG